MCVYLHVHRSVNLPVCLFNFLSSVSVCISVGICVCLCACLSVGQSVYMSDRPSVRPFVWLSACPYVCLSLCLSISSNCLNSVHHCRVQRRRQDVVCRVVHVWVARWSPFDPLLLSIARLISRPVRFTNFDLGQQSADPSTVSVPEGVGWECL